MTYYIESNWFGIIKNASLYYSGNCLFSDKIYEGQECLFSYISCCCSEKEAIKKYRKLLFKKIGE